MPVTFSVAKHPANSVRRQHLPEAGYSANEPIKRACPDQTETPKKVLQYAFSHGSRAAGALKDIVPSPNGFVHTVITAYKQHHALVIRPDDVWLAILCQFNFSVNANAEVLRGSFVAHEGQKELVVMQAGAFDFRAMARQMVELMEKVVDPAQLNLMAESDDAPENLTADRLWKTYGRDIRWDLVLDGKPDHQIECNDVPPRYAAVDVKLDDNDVISPFPDCGANWNARLHQRRRSLPGRKRCCATRVWVIVLRQVREMKHKRLGP